jgi:hypothetical protein
LERWRRRKGLKKRSATEAAELHHRWRCLLVVDVLLLMLVFHCFFEMGF